MNKYKRSVGLFYSRDEAEKALRALKDDGFAYEPSQRHC